LKIDIKNKFQKYIFFGDDLIAIINTNIKKVKKTFFFTPTELNLQGGYLFFSKNDLVPRHIHLENFRETFNTEEILFLLFGKLELTLYSNEKIEIYSEILKKGDSFHLINGGHSIKFLRKSLLIEVKNGPYIQNRDKLQF